MSFALSSELRKRFWRNQSCVVWLGPPARDKELYRLVDQLAAEKSQELGQDVNVDPNHRKVAILTDATGAALAVLVLFADMIEWGHAQRNLGDGRDWLACLIDLVQAERPHLMSSGTDPEATAVLHHLLAENPERLPRREDAS